MVDKSCKKGSWSHKDNRHHILNLFRNTHTLASIAYFITGHGFGHAARASAVISAVHEKNEAIHVDIFTSVPKWFFDSQDLSPHSYHYIRSDIGMVQDSALVENLLATLERLRAYYPFKASEFQWVEEYLVKNDISLIICDISPLGIFLSQRVQIPCLLIENFTWDWIYQGYQKELPAFKEFVSYLAELYLYANWHLQAVPYCQDFQNIDLITNPISRRHIHTRADIRTQLRVEMDEPLVLVTMGGVETNLNLNEELRKIEYVKFIIPGASDDFKLEDNLILIPHHSSFYHPELVDSSDLVIGKLGYSTLAEIYYTGIPMMYFTRPGFRESECLANFVSAEIPSVEITQEQVQSSEWKSDLLNLLGKEKVSRTAINGRYQAADFILQHIGE